MPPPKHTPLDSLMIFTGAISFVAGIFILVYYCKTHCFRLTCITCIKHRRILPTIIDDTDELEIEIPHVTFQVNATEIASSDDEDAIYVEAYKNNTVSTDVVIELPVTIIESDDEDDIRNIVFAVAKQIV